MIIFNFDFFAIIPRFDNVYPYGFFKIIFIVFVMVFLELGLKI